MLLAERKQFPRPKLCGEFISPECLAHFARLGVLDDLLCAGGASIDETLFFAPSGKHLRVPSAWLAQGESPRRHAALGLSRAEMDARLLARARAVGAEVREETSAVGLLVEGGAVRGVRLRRAGGEEETCRAAVTIDASGRVRALARFVPQSDKNQRARLKKRRATLVAFKVHLTHAGEASDGACEIYFYRGGYGGLNRVEGGVSNLCFIAEARAVRAAGSDPERVMREIVMTNRRAAATLAGARVVSNWLSVAIDEFGPRELLPMRGLLAVGDAASFIDPFTGSGMLMALESGMLGADVIVAELTREKELDLDRLGAIYRARYEEKFGARLRFCAALRRLAFAPRAIAELAVVAFGASERIRLFLTRGTRPADKAHLAR